MLIYSIGSTTCGCVPIIISTPNDDKYLAIAFCSGETPCEYSIPQCIDTIKTSTLSLNASISFLAKASL